MNGSGLSGEAPARRDNRTEFAGDGPRASLDRVVGTNQEIERESRRTEASRLRLAWRTGSLPQSLACRPRWVWLVAARLYRRWCVKPSFPTFFQL